MQLHRDKKPQHQISEITKALAIHLTFTPLPLTYYIYTRIYKFIATERPAALEKSYIRTPEL